MAIKVPKGVKVSADTLKYLQSASFKQAVRSREELIKSSTVSDGYFPTGETAWQIVDLAVSPITEGKGGKGAEIGTRWRLIFKEINPASPRDGKDFGKSFAIFKPKTKKDPNKKDFSMDAGELKLMLASALDTDDPASPALVENENEWANIILQCIAQGLVFEGRCFITERTNEKTGRVYTDRHMRTFGLQDEDASPGVESAEEAEEPSDEEVEEAEEVEESEEAEEEETEETNEKVEESEEESDEEVEVRVGSSISFKHPELGETSGTVREVDEEGGTVKIAFRNPKTKKNVVGLYRADTILSVA